ncbi:MULTISPECIES: DUF6941 family protein [unclassified Frankia]|uniref:DUF6941 family protein n=1 Tax=unclassified Frankia TaxID=2632575 RepID=UPI0020257DA8
MKVTMILCDAAQVSEGKLYILGGGWNVAGPGPFPAAIGMLIEVPWDHGNRPLTLHLELHEEDGSPVVLPGPVGPQPIKVEARVEVGRTAGAAKGSPLTAPLAINMTPFPLTPGRRYTWKARIEEEPEDAWEVGFQVRPT